MTSVRLTIIHSFTLFKTTLDYQIFFKFGYFLAFFFLKKLTTVYNTTYNSLMNKYRASIYIFDSRDWWGQETVRTFQHIYKGRKERKREREREKKQCCVKKSTFTRDSIST